MKPLDFQHILKSLADLSHGRREQRLEVLTLPAEGFAAGQIKTCFELAPKCPHCAHDQIHRHGRSECLQRYRLRVWQDLQCLDGNAVGAAAARGKVAGLSSGDAGLAHGSLARSGHWRASQYPLSPAPPISRLVQERPPRTSTWDHRGGRDLLPRIQQRGTHSTANGSALPLISLQLELHEPRSEPLEIDLSFVCWAHSGSPF